MTQPRFSKVISLDDKDNKRTEEIKKKGFTIISIYRKGLEAMELWIKTLKN